MNPISASVQQNVEAESRAPIQAFLFPWRIQWTTQGDDFGRDGHIQIHDERPDGSTTVSHLTCHIQAKGHGAAFDGTHTERLKTRHLLHWTLDGSSTVIVAVWSKASGKIRLRTARQIVAEADRVSPGWRERGTVTVHFRPEHEPPDSRTGRQQMALAVTDEADVAGGSGRFHRVRRRVLLTDLYYGTVSTAQTITSIAEGRNDTRYVQMGPGWESPELDPRDVFAGRVLANAFFLFEEVWVPFGFIGVVLATMGPDLAASMLSAGALVLYATDIWVGFSYTDQSNRGMPVCFKSVNDDFHSLLRRGLRDLAKNTSLSKEFVDLLLRSVVHVPRTVWERAVRETKRDLTKPHLRKLLGLSPFQHSDTEPIWDAFSVNRLLHLNQALAVGEEKNIDVVEYESGLSRVASEKWYSDLGFNRMFPSADAFDAVLRQCGVPDLGLVEAEIGLATVTPIARSDAGQAFRDWFWDSAAVLAGSGADMKEAIVRKLQEATRSDLAYLRVPIDLKLRFVERTRGDYIVGSTGTGPLLGYATRTDRGDLVLRRQVEHQAKRRLSAIRQRHPSLGTYDRCPCGSEQSFRFCCGPKRS